MTFSASSHALRLRRVMPLFLAATAAGAAAQSAPGARAAAPPAPRIHRLMAPSGGYDANAFIIEGRDSLLLVDAMLRRADAEAIAGAIRALGKPLAAIMVTHSHADHFGGVGTVKRAFPSARFIATRALADAIRATRTEELGPDGWLRSILAQFDTVETPPDRLVDATSDLMIGGVEVRLRDAGAGESAAHLLIHVPAANALFSGDATVSGAPFYVGEGRAAAAADLLTRLGGEYPAGTLVFSGHYEPKPLGLIRLANGDEVAMLQHAGAMYAAAGIAEPALTLARALALHHRDAMSYGSGALAIARMNARALVTPTSDPSAVLRSRARALAPLLAIAGAWNAEAAGRPATVLVAMGRSGESLVLELDSEQGRLQMEWAVDAASRHQAIVRSLATGVARSFVERARSGTVLRLEPESGTGEAVEYSPNADGTFTLRVPRPDAPGALVIKAQRRTTP